MAFLVMLKRKLVLICLLILNFNSITFAKSINEENIKALFNQFSAVINSRNPSKIRDFLTYYTDDAAQFYYNRMVKNAKTGIEEQDMKKLNKEAYIQYMIRIASDPIAYSFVLHINSIDIKPDKLSAIVAMHIEEMAIVDKNTITSATEEEKKKNIKAIISTNCNFALATAGSSPVLTSGNCIEKLVFG